MPKRKILVVEAEEALLRLETILLTSRGYEVVAVANGRAALDSIAKETPALILLDAGLPDINGFEICGQIKSNPSTHHVPVVLLTTRTGKEDEVRVLEVAADYLITKPFRSNQLFEVISLLLGPFPKNNQSQGLVQP